MESADDKMDTVDDVKTDDDMESDDDDFEPYTINETPFGSKIMRVDSRVVIKTSPRCHPGEFAAMRYVAKHAPSVPIPTAHFAHWSERGGPGRIVMEYVPGKALHDVWPTLPSELKERVCKDTWEIIQTLRRIPRPEGLPSFYTAVLDSWIPEMNT